MRSPLRALAIQALADASLPTTLGLVAGIVTLVQLETEPSRWSNVNVEYPPSTWPLVPMIASAVWAGIGVAGKGRAGLVHAFARPVTRGSWLAVRLVVLLGMLAIFTGVLAWLAHGVQIREAGPPLVFVVGAIVAGAFTGALAGAIVETETAAVGGAVVGAALLYAPVRTLLDVHAIEWDRLAAGMGVAAAPIVMVTAAALGWPLWWAVRTLPRRDPRHATKAAGLGVGLVFAAYAAMWWPAASRATGPEYGRLIAIAGQPGGPSILFTSIGTGPEGVVIERGAERVPLWGGGVERPRILDAVLSTDGRRLAMSVLPGGGEGRRLVLLDLASGETLESEAMRSLDLGMWSPDGRRFAFSASGHGSGPSVADLTRREVLPLELPGPDAWRMLAWHVEGLVTLRCPGDSIDRPASPTAGGEFCRLERWSEAAPPSVLLRNVPASVSMGPHAAGWTRREHVGDDSAESRLVMVVRPLDGAPEEDLDLGVWSDPSAGAPQWLDARHPYVIVTDVTGGRRRRAWLFEADLEVHQVTAHALGDRGLREIFGPAGGPWLAVDDLGRIRRPGGRLPLALGINLGSRRAPWIPIRRDFDALSVVDPRTGEVVRVPLPASEVVR